MPKSIDVAQEKYTNSYPCDIAEHMLARAVHLRFGTALITTRHDYSAQNVHRPASVALVNFGALLWTFTLVVMVGSEGGGGGFAGPLESPWGLEFELESSMKTIFVLRLSLLRQ